MMKAGVELTGGWWCCVAYSVYATQGHAQGSTVLYIIVDPRLPFREIVYTLYRDASRSLTLYSFTVT